MADPFIGEIRMFGGNFAPVGWSFCNGSTMAISQNDALFSLIGTTYGGDGVQTFNLPNLQGRIPVHQGTGFVLGQVSGSETVTLTGNQIPPHSHGLMSSSAAGTVPTPSGNIIAGTALTPFVAVAPDTGMGNQMIVPFGGNLPHDNMMPFLCVSFILALEGIYPSQG